VVAEEVVAQESIQAEDPTRATLEPMVQQLVATDRTKVATVVEAVAVLVATTVVWAELFMAEMTALIVAKTATT
jgi:hypothetical protein